MIHEGDAAKRQLTRLLSGVLIGVDRWTLLFPPAQHPSFGPRLINGCVLTAEFPAQRFGLVAFLV